MRGEPDLGSYLDEQDVCAGFGEAYGDRLADAPGGAGDEDGFALQREEA